MNYTTFETAKKLKEAGYPQPDFETGQVWYNQYGAATIIGTPDVIRGITHFNVHSLLSGRSDLLIIDKNDGGIFFAPTATDILKELGGDYVLAFGSGEFCLFWGELEREVELAKQGENAAEICADEWIEREMQGRELKAAIDRIKKEK